MPAAKRPRSPIDLDPDSSSEDVIPVPVVSSAAEHSSTSLDLDSATSGSAGVVVADRVGEVLLPDPAHAAQRQGDADAAAGPARNSNVESDDEAVSDSEESSSHWQPVDRGTAADLSAESLPGMPTSATSSAATSWPPPGPPGPPSSGGTLAPLPAVRMEMSINARVSSTVSFLPAASSTAPSLGAVTDMDLVSQAKAKASPSVLRRRAD